MSKINLNKDDEKPCSCTHTHTHTHGHYLLDKNNSVTLIALVITIIILVILACISIGAVVGDNGILNKATEAVDATGTARAREAFEVSVMQDMQNMYKRKHITELI